MNREEAQNFIKSCANKNNIEIYLTKAMFQELSNALEIIPDPNTGLMPCGCGGKAILTEYKYSLYVPLEPPHWAIWCENHCVRNIKGIGREEVIRIWNMAMGWREDK